MLTLVALAGGAPGCAIKEQGPPESDGGGTSSMNDAGIGTEGEAAEEGGGADDGTDDADGDTGGGPDEPPSPCLPDEPSVCTCPDGSFGKSVCGADQTWSPCAGCGDEGCGKGGPCESPSIGCNPWADDCPAGEKCRPNPGNPGSMPGPAACVPVGDDEPGDPCGLRPTSLADTCEASSYCSRVPGGELRCLITCEGSAVNPSCPPEAGEGAVCLSDHTGYGPSLCSVPCDPLSEEPCAYDEGCIGFAGNFMCFPLIETPSLGEECSCGNCCDHGLACVRAEDFGQGCES